MFELTVLALFIFGLVNSPGIAVTLVLIAVALNCVLYGSSPSDG